MSGRRDEEFARLAFERFLSASGMPNQSWKDGADPPDYELTINGVIYPVEVAQLMQPVRSGQTKWSERGWTAALAKIADQVEAEMKRRGVLKGAYCLHLEPAPEPYRVLTSIFPDVECYILATRAKDIAQSHLLWRGKDAATWLIEKVGSTQDMVSYTISTDNGKFSSDIEDDLRGMLNTELSDKRHKTRGLSDVVLIFVDAYHYADSSHWLRVASEINFLPFHTVARVYDDWQCQILYSTSP